ncbi:MAG TPA: hypothetical protein VN683_02120 [Acidothermaceae bacterium]|nr:hypothetical protein [Acidothermaceae bacterium]
MALYETTESLAIGRVDLADDGHAQACGGKLADFASGAAASLCFDGRCRIWAIQPDGAGIRHGELLLDAPMKDLEWPCSLKAGTTAFQWCAVTGCKLNQY